MYLKIKAKKLVLGVCLSFLSLGLLSIATSLGAKPGDYGVAGCGIGSVIFGSRAEAQMLAATTNIIMWDRLFGITSGTSNCDTVTGAALYQETEKEQFIALNYADLKQEIASGQGAKLSGLANLMGCGNSVAFAAVLQKNHAYFFEVDKNKPAEFVKRLESKIKSDSTLATSCELELSHNSL